MTILEIFLSIVIVIETVLLLVLMVAFSRLHQMFKVIQRELTNNIEKTTHIEKATLRLKKDLIDEIEKGKLN